jgi:hypothetical protein
LPGVFVTVAFSPAEPLLACAGADEFTPSNMQRSVHFWKPGGNPVPRALPLTGHCSMLAFSRDGSTLLAATLDPQAPRRTSEGRLTLWRIPGGEQITNFTVSIPVPQCGDSFVAVDRDLKVAAISGATLQIVDLSTGRTTLDCEKRLWPVHWECGVLSRREAISHGRGL